MDQAEIKRLVDLGAIQYGRYGVTHEINESTVYITKRAGNFLVSEFLGIEELFEFGSIEELIEAVF